MASPVAHPVTMTARSLNGVSLASLKRDVHLEARKFHSKWRHPSKFSHSNPFSSSWPLWAKILVALAIYMAAMALVTFCAFTYTEYARSKKDGRPIKWKKVAWKVAKWSFFIWLPLYVYRLVRYRSLKGAKASKYAEINDDQQRLHNPTTTETKAWNAGTPSSDNEQRFEPLGYRSQVYDPYSAYAGVGQPSAEMTSPPTTAGLPPSGMTSPPTTAGLPPQGGLHQPPPMESGDLGARTPSPGPNFASPSQPPPSYKN